MRARLLGTLGRWVGAGRAGRAWGARAGVGAERWARGALSSGRAGRGERRRASGRRAGRAGQAGARQQARARAGRTSWAHGLAAGCALGALGPFSIRFDSFFFPESPNEHCSL